MRVGSGNGYTIAGIKPTTKTMTCLGFEVLNEKTAFYYGLKGHKKIIERLQEYEKKRGYVI